MRMVSTIAGHNLWTGHSRSNSFFLILILIINTNILIIYYYSLVIDEGPPRFPKKKQVLCGNSQYVTHARVLSPTLPHENNENEIRQIKTEVGSNHIHL